MSRNHECEQFVSQLHPDPTLRNGFTGRRRQSSNPPKMHTTSRFTSLLASLLALACGITGLTQETDMKDLAVLGHVKWGGMAFHMTSLRYPRCPMMIRG